MKLPLLIILLVFCNITKATNYYFSSLTGNDNRTSIQAQNPETPWKSLSKLDSYFSNLKPGDSVLFERGNVFYGSFNISNSGAPNRPIVFSAYGTGNTPIISGFTKLMSWESIGRGLYESSCSVCKSGVNMLTLNGVQQAIGRYPNTGYLTYTSHNGKTSISDPQLKNSSNWTGAEIVLRKNHYIIDRSYIESHHDSSIKFETGSNYLPEDGFGYFIQNDFKTLDTIGEWYFNTVQKKVLVFLGASLPASLETNISVLDTLVNIQNQSYCVFNGISFIGANTTAFQINNSQNIKILHCGFNFSGTNAITSLGSSYIDITNSTFDNTNNNALHFGQYQDLFTHHITIQEDTIRNTATLPGMGKKIDDQTERCAIFLVGPNNSIQKCIIDSTGYIPIWYGGESFVVQNNFITNFCFVKDDGGGIWTWNNGNQPITYHNQKVLGNVILGGLGAPSGSVLDDLVGASGIYCDNNSSDIEIRGNSVANCSTYGILLHDAHEISVQENTLFNNGNQISIASDQMHTDNSDSVAHIRNINLKRNRCVSKKPQQYGLHISSYFNDMRQFGSLDSNFYTSPFGSDYVINSENANYSFQPHTLEGWQCQTIYDKESKKSPLRFSPFTYNIISQNRIVNGSFNNDISGVLTPYSPNNNILTSWDNTNKINGGSLRIINTNSSINSYPNINIPIGSISSSKKYLLRFSTLGTVPNKTIFAYLRQTNNPYTSLSLKQPAIVTTSKTNTELLLDVPQGSTASSLMFSWDDSDMDGTFWIDNIELFEVTSFENNPDNSIRFEYNATCNEKIATLDGVYLGVDSTLYTNTITLAPYSSVILLKIADEQTLPLKFLRFEGSEVGKDVYLAWQTANEMNTNYFEIMNSNDGIHFNTIGRQDFTDTTSLTMYTFKDNHPFPGKNFYRIREVDKDGKTVYSNVIVLFFATANSIQISPNPTVNKITVSLYPEQHMQMGAILLIRNINGSILKRMPVPPFQENIQLDISDLSHGSYILSLLSEKTTINEKFIKQ